jgi:hypothetical protein
MVTGDYFVLTKRPVREADVSALVPKLRMCRANATSPHALMVCTETTLFYVCVRYNLRIFMGTYLSGFVREISLRFMYGEII